MPPALLLKRERETWSPVKVQEPNFMMQVCWSKGKYVTSIVQDDWK
jgi:hypothetical protein